MQEKIKKFDRVLQSSMPRAFLRDVFNLAVVLRDNFAGKNARPIDLAGALNWSPSSSGWRILTGAAVAYGLTDNAYNAQSISLTALGQQIVKPTVEGEEKQGLLMALLRPTIAKSFYEKYDRSKFPKDDIAKNVLNQLGVPQDRTDEALKIVIDNAKFVGVLDVVNGGNYIQLSMPTTYDVDKITNNDTEGPSSVPLRENIQEVRQNKNEGGDTFEFIENELSIILSKDVQKKAWLSKELTEKVQGLMQAAQALADELNKKNH